VKELGRLPPFSRLPVARRNAFSPLHITFFFFFRRLIVLLCLQAKASYFDYGLSISHSYVFPSPLPAIRCILFLQSLFVFVFDLLPIFQAAAALYFPARMRHAAGVISSFIPESLFLFFFF